MRGYALLLGTCLTLGYGYAAQAAMIADRNGVARRLSEAVMRREAPAPQPLWYGGTLATITVEAIAPAAPGRPADRRVLRHLPAVPGHSVRIS